MDMIPITFFLWKWELYLLTKLSNGTLVGDTEIHKDYVWDTICECLQVFIAIWANTYPVCNLTYSQIDPVLEPYYPIKLHQLR